MDTCFRAAAMSKVKRWALVIFVLLSTSIPAFAHSDEPLQPHDLWTSWEWDPGIIIPLLLTGWLYVRGIRRTALRRRYEIVAYLLGWFVLLIALVSPIHPLGEALFSVHMAQHGMLMLIAAPLLVIGRPLVPFLFALPMRWRKALGNFAKKGAVSRTWKILTAPMIAWCVHAAALWVWHIPALYGRTLESDTIHTLQHLSFLISALLFWWALVHGREGRLGYGAGVVYLFTTAIHTSILGALLTVARVTWYPVYSTRTSAWGLTPLEDQQLAGLIMWVPGGIVYLAAGLLMFMLWLNQSERAQPWQEIQHDAM
jgi:putative membrane protein